MSQHGMGFCRDRGCGMRFRWKRGCGMRFRRKGSGGRGGCIEGVNSVYDEVLGAKPLGVRFGLEFLERDLKKNIIRKKSNKINGLVGM